ncbi:uncharacterized protein [Miscanthus floridulus]|uniref:uncharacterized protein n=1 Tax=Miscanthus floridulus TaxID=154761 RepID=UPI003459DB10
MSIREARRQPGGLDGGDGAGGGGGDATTSAEGRGGVGVRRGPIGTGGHGGRATAATTAVVEAEGHSAEEVVSPFKKRQVEAPALAPRKALKVSTSSHTQWVVEAQATIERGAVSSRADLKEPVAQGEATEVATKQAGEEAPMPYEAEARVSDEAEAPPVAEATKGEAEAPRTFEAEATEAEAPRTTEAKVAEAGVGVAKPAA